MEQQNNTMIRIEALTKTYAVPGGTVDALKGIDLEIRQGEIFGIIGMSGAGKSTLIRCMNLLERPTSGTIQIDGQDVTGLSKKALRQMRHSVGMIFQQFNLLMQTTVKKNIAFPLEITGVDKAQCAKRVKELLEIVGLSDKADAYPAQLSGGQKQRVAIARALAANPKVLLCDEATSALDPMTTDSILELLKRINQQMGITIVVITHEMEVIRKICHRVAIIDGGVIAEQGEVTEIFTAPKTAAAKKLFHVLPEGESGKGGAVLRLVFDGKQLYQPVVAGMILACGVPVSILSAEIRTIGQGQYGQLTIQLPDDLEACLRARQYLKEQGVQAEEVETE